MNLKEIKYECLEYIHMETSNNPASVKGGIYARSDRLWASEIDCASQRYYIIIAGVQIIHIEYDVFNISPAETTLAYILLIAGEHSSLSMYLLFCIEQTDFKILKAGHARSRKPQ
jgi:hypothetical protein